jgi:ribosomal protein L12E/L44/L45/RPP1/RPP2
MLVLGGNASPSASDVKTAMAAVGIEADDARLNTLISELEGKDLNEILAAGKELLAKFGGGGGGGGGGAGAAAGGEAAEEEVKEKVEEEEMDMSGGIDMFGGGEAGGGDY